MDSKNSTDSMLNSFAFDSSSGYLVRSGSRAAATSKIERFMIIVNGWKPLTSITKRSILDFAAALDPLVLSFHIFSKRNNQ